MFFYTLIWGQASRHMKEHMCKLLRACEGQKTYPDAIREAPAAGLGPALWALHKPARVQQRSQCVHKMS